MKFLVVDDSRAIQAIMRRAIQKAGFVGCEFKSATSGVEALRVLESGPVDLVITDWHMPGMSGLDLLKKLRGLYPGNLKVGFVTTESAKTNIDEAKKLGALFFLRKPFDDDELARTIRNCIGQTPPAAGESGPEVEPEVTVAALPEASSLLESLLSDRASISSGAPGSADELRFPSAVGLYSLDGSNAIRGLCLLDYRAVALLVAAPNDSMRDVERAMAAKEVPAELSNRVSEVFSREMTGLFKSSDARKLRLVRTQLLKQQIPQLREIMKRSPFRNDFSIVREGLPAGQLTLISK